jgi:L-ascorbate metabolism protein UlaG (beta-lactamase superfamily)
MKEPTIALNESKPKHHAASGFRNHPHKPEQPASRSLGISFYFRRFKVSFFPPEVPSGHVMSEQQALLSLNDLKDQNTITWLGQSTFLIRIDGKNVLTDPFLTNNAFPLSWGGPERYSPPGLKIKNLPPIDIVIISHDHHDHLDPKTLAALPRKENIAILVPLGLKDMIEEMGFKTIHELDWHQSVTIGEITLTALPAVHNSGRGLNNQNKNLWCSWAIRNTSINLYFAGDTAYSSSAFKEIGAMHGPFDVALVPIGAYEPRDFMRAYHANPEEAVQIGLDLNAKTLIAMHWGTIDLSDEPHWEPPQRFRAHANANGYPAEQAWVLKIGETRALSR